MITPQESGALRDQFISFPYLSAPCQLQGCTNRPAVFPGQMSYTVTKPGSASLSFTIVDCAAVYYGHLLCIVILHFYVFCLLVVLVKLSILAKWLARKTPLRKPNHGMGIVSTKPRLKTVYDFLGFVYCFIVLWCFCLVPWSYVIYFIHDIAC